MFFMWSLTFYLLYSIFFNAVGVLHFLQHISYILGQGAEVN